MKICIIGSGGREHSLCYKLIQSPIISKVYCFPGNPGTENIAENVSVDINNFEEIYDEVLKHKIELLIVGPEVPLVNGIVDYFEQRNIKIFGPNKLASQLEGSKIFMKNLCDKFNIPSAKFKEIRNLKEAEEFFNVSNAPFVIKADGIAVGKGVTICNDKINAMNNINEILNGKFKTSSKVIVEEFLDGEEASYFILTDGNTYKNIGTAQDHKRIGEGDTGLNTGGMGAYSPSYLISKEIEKKIQNKIIKPTIEGMKKIGCTFKGILYAGLMIKDGEPKLIEYNIRFGDPECQVLMMRLKSDLLKLIMSTIKGNLKDEKIEWIKEPCITVVAASKGYPESFEKNIQIKNIEAFEQNEKLQIFHAGTKRAKNGELLSVGGRVLNSTVVSKDLKSAKNIAIDVLDKLDWENKYFRKDIGNKAINK